MSTTQPRPGRGASIALGLVGVAMFLGFGGLTGSLALETYGAPPAPHEMRMESAASWDGTAPGAWARIVDVVVPCSIPERAPDVTSRSYRLATDPTARAWLLIESDSPLACSDTPVELTGTLRTMAPGRIVDLEFPERPWAAWGEGPLVALHPGGDPRTPISSLVLCGAVALLGLLIARFYFSAGTRSALVPVLDGGDMVPSGPVMPARPLRLRREHRASPWLGTAFLACCGAMFASLAAFVAEDATGDVFSWALIGFFVLLTAFCAWAAVVLVWSAVRPLPAARIDRAERWLPLVAVEHLGAGLPGHVDVGNRVFVYERPGGAGQGRLVVAADEAVPWIVDGHLLSLGARGDDTRLVFVRVDGGPFALSPSELRELSERTRQRPAA